MSFTSKKLAEAYDQIADDYHRDHAKDTWDNDFLEDFSGRLAKGSTVLDLGCGPGIESEKLVKKGFHVTGFDISENLLKIAHEKAPEAAFIHGDMLEPLPFSSGQFDALFAKASLLHVPKAKIEPVLREIARVTKNGGIIHIAVKKGHGEEEVAENDYGYEYKRWFSFWQPEELEAKFAAADLDIIEKGVWQNPGRKTIWLKYILKKRES
ncbi:MAG: class I SAM-dependent methyltransferase [Patescibacteria group bacterium]|nr:methyltransferase domain-containing protein [Patescibacteria group bacterium]MDE1941140.1 class I SAM-dependent methyltransferase [Patescibacteria group bacterium]MDE1966969.1 class I SAM-dependent methyltransferase [Patescibacteria group bacterium]